MQLTSQTPVALTREALSQLATTLLSYVITLVALSTLSPFKFVLPSQIDINLNVEAHDVLLNLLLLLPAGFLFSLTRDPPRLDQQSLFPRRPPRPSDALLAGGALSLSLEALQLLSPHRYCSPVDLLANATGAYAGAVLFQRLRPFVARGLAYELTLRMPLTHFFYLLTLLLMIDGLMGRGAPGRRLLVLPLAAAGALLCAAIYNHRLRAQTRVHPFHVALFAAVWCFLGSVANWVRAPALGVGAACGCALLTYGLCRLRFPRDVGRRFELPTLQIVAVPMVSYLAGLFLQSQAPRSAEHDQRLVFDAIEALAALTLIGYGVAESMGRWVLNSRRALLWTPALVTPVAAAMEWIAAGLSGYSPRPWLIPATMLFSLWGVAIYRAELRVVQALTQSSPIPAAGIPAAPARSR